MNISFIKNMKGKDNQNSRMECQIYYYEKTDSHLKKEQKKIGMKNRGYILH